MNSTKLLILLLLGIYSVNCQNVNYPPKENFHPTQYDSSVSPPTAQNGRFLKHIFGSGGSTQTIHHHHHNEEHNKPYNPIYVPQPIPVIQPQPVIPVIQQPIVHKPVQPVQGYYPGCYPLWGHPSYPQIIQPFPYARQIVTNQPIHSLDTHTSPVTSQSQPVVLNLHPGTSSSPNPSTNSPQSDFNALLQYAQNQPNPYLTPNPFNILNSQFPFQSQLQQQPSLGFQASLQSSWPSSILQNLITKPLNFLRPPSTSYPSVQPTYYPPASQYVPHYQQPQWHQPLLQPLNQYYPQTSYNPYQNFIPVQNPSYYPQTSSQIPFPPQVSNVMATQVPLPINQILHPSYQYSPFVPHGQIQYSQQLPTPFLVDLARYIYGK
ncbi:uncharacterized protein LOC129609790 [Condylostylus longicornis]|uniref:uncharacterized protein LOC129609790 n=1 Tax=Condylostylus longicornis TaxID=2530218 RepID=UPI00244E15F4|nr:uncharacterized protein LOC129609790 [Condylostylus longicornis]